MSMEGLAMDYINGSNNLNEQKVSKGNFIPFLLMIVIKVQLQLLLTQKKFLKLLLDSNRIEREQSKMMEDTDG
eukprot:11319147-Ditylum_brightwellii.AAC.1